MHDVFSDPNYVEFFSRAARQYRAERANRTLPPRREVPGDRRVGVVLADAAHLSGLAERIIIDVAHLVEIAAPVIEGIDFDDERPIDIAFLIAELGALNARLIRIADRYGAFEVARRRR